MALVGVQLVISMVMASLLSKLSTHMSFGRWLLVNKLVRYLHPTDEELRTLAKIPTDTGKGRGRNKQPKQNDAFTVPKSLEFQMECAPIGPRDIMPLKYFLEFQWLMDFSFVGILIFLMTELYYALVQPDNEFNLSMMWCLLVIGFCVKIMFSLTVIYFSTEESGERILIFIFGMLFLILAMAMMITSEDMLEIGLEPGYHNFTRGARDFMEKQGIGSQGPATLTTLKIILAIGATILGAFLTFPGLRMAKMHTDALKYTSNPFVKLCLSLNLMFPIMISIMWVKPVMRDFLVRRTTYGLPILLTEDQFDAVRIICLLLFCVFRFCLMWTHLQAHLNMAHEKVEQLRKEAGRISTIELQQMITRVFYYLCVVALQYVTPLVLLLYCTMMLKTLGEVDLFTPFGLRIPPLTTASAKKMTGTPGTVEQTISETAAQFQIALAALREVFTPMFFRGVLTFFSWWTCVSWFTTTAFGMLYYQYFAAI